MGQNTYHYKIRETTGPRRTCSYKDERPPILNRPDSALKGGGGGGGGGFTLFFVVVKLEF